LAYFSRPALFGQALAAPAAALVFYGLLRGFSLFTPLDAQLSWGALALFLLWVLSALRGATHYWSRWGHLRFFTALVLLVGFSSCWGLRDNGTVKAWVTPPAYARSPAVPLDESGRVTDVLAGSFVHISQPGDAAASIATFGALEETIDGDHADEATVSFAVPQLPQAEKLRLLVRRGWLRLGVWSLRAVPDQAPRIAFTEEPAITTRKTIRFAFDASDDYGVETVSVRVSPSASVAPGVSQEAVEVILSHPGVKQARSAGYADLTPLPWAGSSVMVQLIASDGAGHKSFSAAKPLLLPARSFHNPFARALIEERQKLLGQPDPSARDEAANVMAGIARQQGLYHGDTVVLMALRAGAVRLVLSPNEATISALRELIWQTALRLEEGSIGLARANLAAAEQDLSSLLMRAAHKEEIAPYFAEMKEALTAYFTALEDERTRQPPSLQEVDWPLSTPKELLTPEDLQNQLASIEPLLDSGAYADAAQKLDHLQDLFENLRTTPPELTPEQYKLVEQTSSLRALVRGQKKLIEDMDALNQQEHKTYKGHLAWQDNLTHLLTQQQVLLAALTDVAQKIETPSRFDAKAGVKAMSAVVAALQRQDLNVAQQKQAEALGMMENSLLALSERMRQALTAATP